MVDDSEAVRISVAEVLRFVGFTVIESGDGHDALRLLRTMRFDAVVLDLCMPGLDGMSMLGAVPRPPPVVVLSAYGPDAVATDSAPSVLTHLRKPVAPQRLIEAVSRAVERAGGGR